MNFITSDKCLSIISKEKREFLIFILIVFLLSFLQLLNCVIHPHVSTCVTSNNVRFSPIVFKMSSFVLFSVQLILRNFPQHHISSASNISLFFLFIVHVSRR